MLNDSNIITTFIAATILIGCLLLFFFIFIFVFQKKQIQNIQEKAALQAQYEQEILNSENEIQEQTMKHISRELHDNVAQMLTLTKIQLNNLAEDHPAITKIADSKSIINQTLAEVRNLSKSLDADNLLNAGLGKAIIFEIERIQKATNINIVHSVDYHTFTIDSKKEVLVFRIFQELMQNILKHAQSKNINIHLYINLQSLNLDVTDDGVGFDITKKNQSNTYEQGSGLSNLFYRAQLLNGELTFENRSSGGTIARLTIPN